MNHHAMLSTPSSHLRTSHTNASLTRRRRCRETLGVASRSRLLFRTFGIGYHRARSVDREGVRVAGLNLRMFFLLVAALAILVLAFLLAVPAIDGS